MKGNVLANASAVDRSKTDFYPTPENVTLALCEYLGLKDQRVWEPACGQGHMARALEAQGNTVVATDLYPQGYGVGNSDFLAEEPDEIEFDWIITNPPFKLAEQFILRSIEHGKPFAMLLKSQYWHSSRRRNLFEAHRPQAVLPLTWRPDFHFGTKGGSPTMEVAWTVWGGKPANCTEYVPLPKPSANPGTIRQDDLFPVAAE